MLVEVVGSSPIRIFKNCFVNCLDFKKEYNLFCSLHTCVFLLFKYLQNLSFFLLELKEINIQQNKKIVHS